jgi:hypothetical protein
MTGHRFVIFLTTLLGIAPAGAAAQAKPSSVRALGIRPSFATARCNDGTFWTHPERVGACGGHGGVSEWFRPDPPKDATARCTDMTWSASNDPQAACVRHGGVRFWLRPRRPPNVTARCGDGSWWTDPEPQNACPGRGGVSEWYGGPGGALPEKNSPPPHLRPPET